MSNASQKGFAFQNSSYHLQLSVEAFAAQAQHGFECLNAPGFRLQVSFAHLFLHLFDLAVFAHADSVRYLLADVLNLIHWRLEQLEDRFVSSLLSKPSSA